MSCNQQPLLERLAVEEPAALKSPAWKNHLESCAECRHARYALERSLAVFRHFEAHPPTGELTGPSWERLSHALSRDRRRRVSRLRVPLAAASVLLAVSTGVLLWPVAQEETRPPRPAKLVTLQPEHHMELRRVMNSSLGAPMEAVMGDGSHETVAASADGPTISLRGLEPNAVATEPYLAERNAVPMNVEVTDTANTMFGNTPTERAPVMIFRTLQQRRSRLPSIEVLPVSVPLQPDGGSLLRRAMQSPRPIR